ncbi:uncharacterized protein MEPE_02356 [Melanopsichium pennsylvanicum]|uniref:Uncharacterized protein n=1 Tax=Melanopsichium pennsylvanicum TaxID=63383 RepID=A0AAJ4XJ84_9BASI|nr:uncharacterized protein MEPE_02356 [Melanopsichium pennsylvanicum]
MRQWLTLSVSCCVAYVIVYVGVCSESLHSSLGKRVESEQAPIIKRMVRSMALEAHALVSFPTSRSDKVVRLLILLSNRGEILDYRSLP